MPMTMDVQYAIPPSFKENINKADDKKEFSIPGKETEMNISNLSNTGALDNSMDVDPAFESTNLDNARCIL